MGVPSLPQAGVITAKQMWRSRTCPKALVLTVILLLQAALASAQSNSAERVYSYSAADVNQALRDLDAFSGAKLPVIEGFTKADPSELSGLERPYYQFKVEVVTQDAGHTLVRLQAKITASYTDSATGHSEYRALPSNGRLENDLLDRLEDSLKKSPNQLPAGEAALQQQLADLQTRHKELDKKIIDLQAGIKPGEAPLAQRVMPKIGVVKGQSVSVLNRPAQTGHTLLQVSSGDELEVAGENADWYAVKLGGKSRGWVRRSQLDLAESKDENKPISSAEPAGDQNFNVRREEVKTFRSNWPSLKGRKAIFIYAQAKSASSRYEKLAFAKKIFTERYLQASHSTFSFAGVVIAFDTGQQVVAATLSNIRAWVNGSITDPAFVSRCWIKLPPG